jgi:hypothetical protein
MTEYAESDRKWVKATSEELSLSNALEQTCYNCDEPMVWTLDPDPDSLRYTAECRECEYTHQVKPTKARVIVNEQEQ